VDLPCDEFNGLLPEPLNNHDLDIFIWPKSMSFTSSWGDKQVSYGQPFYLMYYFHWLTFKTASFWSGHTICDAICAFGNLVIFMTIYVISSYIFFFSDVPNYWENISILRVTEVIWENEIRSFERQNSYQHRWRAVFLNCSTNQNVSSSISEIRQYVTMRKYYILFSTYSWYLCTGGKFWSTGLIFFCLKWQRVCMNDVKVPRNLCMCTILWNYINILYHFYWELHYYFSLEKYFPHMFNLQNVS
jgi:hypothetical protein